MNPLSGKTVPAKPIAGLAVILFIATVIGGWLFVDNIRGELEARIEALEARLVSEQPSARPMPQPEGGRMMEPTAANGWRLVQGSLGDYEFQLNLPPGYQLSEATGAMGNTYAYVMMNPISENETLLPDMVINLVGLQNELYASKLGKDEPGTRLVAASGGQFGFWITGWEDHYWEPFDLVAASFKGL